MQYKHLQKDYQTIQDSLLINNPENYDRSYHSLADALQNHLSEKDNIEVERILRRLQQLSEKSIVEIQNKSKNLLNRM